MEVVKEKVEVLSNYEVLALLDEVLASDSGGGEMSSKHGTSTMRHRNQQNLATIAYETTKYLKGTPCALQNDPLAKRFLAAVDKFNLTKTERLQLLNLRPTTPVEINLLVSECEERLTEDEVNDLLGLVADLLPGDADVEEVAAADEVTMDEESAAT